MRGGSVKSARSGGTKKSVSDSAPTYDASSPPGSDDSSPSSDSSTSESTDYSGSFPSSEGGGDEFPPSSNASSAAKSRASRTSRKSQAGAGPATAPSVTAVEPQSRPSVKSAPKGRGDEPNSPPPTEFGQLSRKPAIASASTSGAPSRAATSGPPSRAISSSGPPSRAVSISGPPSRAQTSTPDSTPEDSPESSDQSDDDLSAADSEDGRQTIMSALSDPSHGYSDHYGHSKMSSRASRMYGEEATVEEDSEDDLPPPPKHLVDKKISAMDLDVGLRKLPPRPPSPKGPARTTLAKAAKVGDNKVQVALQDGFKVGMFVEIGSGSSMTRARIVAFGSFILDRPLRCAYPAGTSLVETNEPVDSPQPSEPPTPASDASLSDATPSWWPEEPKTPASYHYSGVPSPPGSVGGFSVRSQQAGMAAKFGSHFGDMEPAAEKREPRDWVGDAAGPSSAAISMRAIKDGFHLIRGKFDAIGDTAFPDDPYEDMYYKYLDPELLIIVESDVDTIRIDLGGGRAFVYEDVDDPTLCFLFHEESDTKLSFRALSEKAMQSFLDEMPPSVFEYPDEDDEEDEGGEEGAGPSTEAKGEGPVRFNIQDPEFKERDYGDGAKNAKKMHNDQRLKKRKNVRAKGQEARAEAEEAGAIFGGPPEDPPPEEEDLGALIGPPPASPGGYFSVQQDRSFSAPQRLELRPPRATKSVPSVRRIKLLCRWLDVLRFWPTKLSVATLHKEFCTGLLLLDLVKKLIPSSTFVNVNKTALSKQAAVQNINQALTAIYCSKSVNAARVPTPDDIFSGSVSKIATLIDEMFVVCVRGPLYQQSSIKMLQWYNNLLKSYSMPLPAEVIEQGDVASEDQLWKAFQSGVALFCVIYHFHGPVKIPICPKHSNKKSLGDMAPIGVDEYNSAPRFVRDSVGLSDRRSAQGSLRLGLSSAIARINAEIAERFSTSQRIGAEFSEGDYSPSLSFDDLHRVLEEEDRGETEAIVDALVHFRRLARTEAPDRRSRYQAYCESCAGSIRIDPMRIVRNPVGFTDTKANVTYVFALLRALGIDLLWEADDWLTNPDVDFVLLQLSYVYDALKNRQGVLPAASGVEAGYTSGPTGEVVVVGVVFADTPLGLEVIDRHSKTVILGAGYHDIPFTPIDTTAEEEASRYFSNECPLGLLSDHVALAREHVQASFAKPKKAASTWNGQMCVDIVEDPGHHEVLSILKKVHKKTDGSHTASIHKIFAADASVADISTLQSKERKSKLDRRRDSAEAPPKRRHTITRYNAADMTHEVVELSSEEQVRRAQRQLLEKHRKDIVSQLEEDLRKMEKYLQEAEDDLALDLEYIPDDDYKLKNLRRHDEEVKALEGRKIRVARFFKMRRDAIEDQYNEFKMRSVTFARTHEASSEPVAASTLLNPSNIGATRLDVVATASFRVGQLVEVGVGSHVDKGRIVDIGSSSSKEPHSIEIDTPTSCYHQRGTEVVGFEVTHRRTGMAYEAFGPAGGSGGVATDAQSVLTMSSGISTAASLRSKMLSWKASAAVKGRMPQPVRTLDTSLADMEAMLKQVYIKPKPGEKQPKYKTHKTTGLEVLDERGLPVPLTEEDILQQETRRTKAALDKKFPGNPVPLESIAAFVARQRKVLKDGERGWNLTNTKAVTHNAKIRQKNEANRTLLEESWTPAAVREKQHEDKQRKVAQAMRKFGLQPAEMGSLAAAAAGSANVSTVSSRKSGVSLHAGAPPSDSPEDVFHRFKIKLVAMTTMYREAVARREGRAADLPKLASIEAPKNVAERELEKLSKLGFSGLAFVRHLYGDLPRAAPGSEPLLLQLLQKEDPFGEQSGQHLGPSAQAVALKIRDEELMRALYEDRRSELLALQPKAAPVKAPEPAPVAPVAPVMVPSHLQDARARVAAETAAVEARQQREVDVEAALDFLGEERVLVLADRHSEQEACFRVCRQRNARGVTEVVLQWKEPAVAVPAGDDWSSVLQGALCVSDFKSLAEGDGPCVIIGIDSTNAKALKGCRGRTKLVLRPSRETNAADMRKFYARLSTLHTTLKQLN